MGSEKSFVLLFDGTGNTHAESVTLQLVEEQLWKYCIRFYIGITALHQDTIFFTKLWLPLFFIHSWEGISLLQNSVCYVFLYVTL
jgi:hypothetical protein